MDQSSIETRNGERKQLKKKHETISTINKILMKEESEWECTRIKAETLGNDWRQT